MVILENLASQQDQHDETPMNVTRPIYCQTGLGRCVSPARLVILAKNNEPVQPDQSAIEKVHLLLSSPTHVEGMEIIFILIFLLFLRQTTDLLE